MFECLNHIYVHYFVDLERYKNGNQVYVYIVAFEQFTEYD